MTNEKREGHLEGIRDAIRNVVSPIAKKEKFIPKVVQTLMDLFIGVWEVRVSVLGVKAKDVCVYIPVANPETRNLVVNLIRETLKAAGARNVIVLPETARVCELDDREKRRVRVLLNETANAEPPDSQDGDKTTSPARLRPVD